jgi:putative SOS response-associated peptidase YedK
MHSFTLLTVNADGHPIMGRLHRPEDEKRMPVIIARQHFAQWLNATPANASQFMQTTPADLLRGQPAPRGGIAQPVNLSLF